MSVELALEQFRPGNRFAPHVTHWQTTPPREASWAPMPDRIPAALQAVYRNQGIEQLYSHQAEAIEAVLDGKHTVIVTPTASGKSICYNLPVLSAILDNPDTRAIYLFPTKALAQDQTANLNQLFAGHDLEGRISIFTYDGDTPSSIRPSVRTKGQIIITNPDMLHGGIQPNHPKWTKVFEGLRYVVIDEMHTYRGVFGSHLANLIRRLKRIAAFYGARPQFILCSATIGNPGELAARLIEDEVVVVDKSGAPGAGKHFLLYNPPLVDPGQGIRRSLLLESARVASVFLERGVQTIVFARSRLNTELIAGYIKDKLPNLASRIVSYRGGFLPNERRRIEKGLRDGSIQGVVSTTALELGIDIGDMDAAVLAGYPGSVAGLMQQAGRAGRRSKVSAAVLVASSAPVDQYVVNHADFVFNSRGEDGFVNPENLYILMSHLKCSAFELPFQQEERFGREVVDQALRYLEEEKVLHASGGKYYWMEQGYPAEEISLRSSTPGNFVIINTNGVNGMQPQADVIGETDRASAPYLIFEGAIYIHGGRQYQVERLDYDNRKAYVREVQVDYYTDAISKTDIKILEEQGSIEKQLSITFGEILVRTQVPKYKKIKFHTHENLGYGDIHLPEEQMHTESCWISFPERLFGEFTHQEKQNTLLAVSVLLKNLTPLYLLCSPGDIMTSAQVRNEATGLPCVFLFDLCPGGIGLAHKAYRIYPLLFQEAAAHVATCPCDNGCPSCIGPAEYGYDAGFKLKVKELLENINRILG